MKSIFHNNLRASAGSISSCNSFGSSKSAMATSPSLDLAVFHFAVLVLDSACTIVGSSMMSALGPRAGPMGLLSAITKGRRVLAAAEREVMRDKERAICDRGRGKEENQISIQDFVTKQDY